MLSPIPDSEKILLATHQYVCLGRMKNEAWEPAIERVSSALIEQVKKLKLKN